MVWGRFSILCVFVLFLLSHVFVETSDVSPQGAHGSQDCMGTMTRKHKPEDAKEN
jgi:hypothetical protein